LVRLLQGEKTLSHLNLGQLHTYSKDAFEHLSKRPIAINPAEVGDNYISTIMIK